jgi:hypothetical protein
VAWVIPWSVTVAEEVFLGSWGLLTLQVPVGSVVQDVLPVTPPSQVPVTMTVACHPVLEVFAVLSDRRYGSAY